MMRIFRDFDELKAAAGTEVGVSDWIEVTQERIDQFARATGDDQWIHVDVARAERELPGGTTIANGRITIAAVEDAPQNGLWATYGVTVEIENRERPACVAELMAVHYR